MVYALFSDAACVKYNKIKAGKAINIKTKVGKTVQIISINIL